MRSSVRRVSVALCLLALSVGAALTVSPAPAATLYKWVDAQGVVHYSDTPHDGAEKIQVSGAQTFHSTPVPVTPPATTAPPAAATGPYVSCSITQPTNGAGLFAPEAVDVAVQTQPALQPGDYVSAAVDGQSLGSEGTHFRITQPDRGDHTVSAEVRNADGTVLCTASPVTFSVQRPSTNAPQSPVKPH
jgi:hypothetical protein